MKEQWFFISREMETTIFFDYKNYIQIDLNITTY